MPLVANVQASLLCMQLLEDLLGHKDPNVWLQEMAPNCLPKMVTRVYIPIVHEGSCKPIFLQHWVLSHFLSFTGDRGVRQVFPVLGCISSITDDDENPFLRSFVACVSCLWYVCPCLLFIFLLGWLYFSCWFAGYFMHSSYASFAGLMYYGYLLSFIYL